MPANLEVVIAMGKDDATLYGNSGFSALSGGNGDDWLFGYGDDDLLAGWFGQDRLEGGSGADVFYFETAHSASKVARADVIADFEYGDQISLENWDANRAKRGDQDFKLIESTTFSGKPGEIRWEYIRTPSMSSVVRTATERPTSTFASRVTAFQWAARHSFSSC